jgi:hypothetical protein
MFRSGDMTVTFKLLNEINLSNPNTTSFYRSRITSPADLNYGYALQAALSKMEDIHLRVENPWISVYTNSKKDVTKLEKIDPDRVKYVCCPPAATALESGTIILPKVNFEFKVTLGKTNSENSAFIEWAETNPKVKLTKSCKSSLTKDFSWGGSYFYITGEKNLLVAKMHLGGSINKIERILKA